jgi:hypothetical protein
VVTDVQHRPRLFVTQKLTMAVNRYAVLAAGPDGAEGELLALAQQKRMAFKEQVTFYADESRSREVFSFRARKVVDLGSGYDIQDAAGQQLGTFRKDFKQSLLRSTFHLEGPGYAGTGQERNVAVAMLRRFTDLPFLAVHFDFVGSDGAPLMSVDRRPTLRDRYLVDVPDPRVDYRVAAAVAVGLDALMSR